MYFIGIDISKFKHDCAIIDEAGDTVTASWSFANNCEGFSLLKQLLDALDGQKKIGFESTGHYGHNLKLFLETNNFSFMEFNPLLVSKFVRSKSLRNTKTDSLDAVSIAQYLMTVEYKPYPPSFYHMDQLKSLTRFRDSLVRQHSRQLVELTNILDKVFPEFKPFFDGSALLRHYLDHGIDEGRKPSADGIAGDDELSLTEAQFSSLWSPVAINKLAHYKSLKRKCTDEEFAQAYQEALKVVTPLALMSRENQLYGIASALRAVVDDGSMAYSMEANHYNDPYGYFVLRTASCAGCARATALCLDILGIPYEHVNENQYSHQWCRVPMEDGSYWICDAFGLYCGPEPEPYQHPYF